MVEASSSIIARSAILRTWSRFYSSAGSPLAEQPAYPAQLLFCKNCTLAQLGLIVDPAILFPPSYPYTSGTTKILRENFAELSREVESLYPLKPSQLIIDIGSNDGTLLSNFQKNGVRVFGIEPTNAAKLAIERGIPSMISFFNKGVAEKAAAEQGKAQIVTATNVFAHDPLHLYRIYPDKVVSPEGKLLARVRQTPSGPAIIPIEGK